MKLFFKNIAKILPLRSLIHTMIKQSNHKNKPRYDIEST